MNLNRRKNLFTLGNLYSPPAPQQNVKNKLRHQKNADLFERDPFKIQSYNFRYADRPIFPIPALQQTSNNYSSLKDCQTFFYNNEFPRNRIDQKSAFNLTKFQEYRRKKFLQDPSAARNCNLINSFNNANSNNGRSVNSKPFNSNILNLYYGSSRPQQNYAQDFKESKCSQNNSTQNFNIRQKLSHSSVINDARKESKSSAEIINPQNVNTNLTRPMISHIQQKPHQSLVSISRGEGNQRHRSLSSGCEININIKGFENDSITDNVSIKIETDSIGKNLDTPKVSRLQSSAQSTQNLEPSSKSFVIDKRLSKFSLNPAREELFKGPVQTDLERKITSQSLQQQEQKCLKDRQKERIKSLTSVYCPQLVQTGKKNSRTQMTKSSNRIPSMIPFKSNSDIGNYHQCKIENLSPTKKSLQQRAKETTRSKPTNDLNSYCTNSLLDERKILNSSLLTAKRSFFKKLNASKNSLSSCSNRIPMVTSLYSLPVRDHRPELKPISPVSVNINVFADKLKIIRD